MEPFYRSLRLKLIIYLLLIVFLLLTPFPVSAQSESPPIPEFIVTPEILAAIAGAALSLAFSYIPGLNVLFAALDETRKKLIMAGLLLVAACAVYGLGCGGILQVGLACDRNGVVQLVWIYILAIMANQGVFKLSPQTNAVKAEKA